MSSPTSSPANVTPSALPVDAQGMPTTYTNLFRASGSSEELILDFGLDLHRRTPDGGDAAVMLQRVVLTWGHAKCLAVMLRDLVQLHEQSHGPIPLDPANPPPPM